MAEPQSGGVAAACRSSGGPELIAHSFCRLPEVTLHLVEAGPRGGLPTILLHGFPEFWWGWRGLIGPLARAGLRVIAPDQRGYNLSSKPAGTGAYVIDALAGDVIGLADRLGARRLNLVGHDWGGIVAWWIAQRYPERVDKLIAINAPHPGAAIHYAKRHPVQLLRSSYAGFFQLPYASEALLRAGGFFLLRKAMVTTSAPRTFTRGDLARYCEAWSRPDALEAMLNWYRAVRRQRRTLDLARILPSTLIIWGTKDAFLEPGLAQASLGLCEHGRIRWFEGASHWVHHEQREAVAEEIRSFLCPDGSSPGILHPVPPGPAH